MEESNSWVHREKNQSWISVLLEVLTNPSISINTREDVSQKKQAHCTLLLHPCTLNFPKIHRHRSQLGQSLRRCWKCLGYSLNTLVLVHILASLDDEDGFIPWMSSRGIISMLQETFIYSSEQAFIRNLVHARHCTRPGDTVVRKANSL